MAEYKFGLIGTGHMGSALLKSVAQAVDPKKIILSNRSPEKAMALAERYGCAVGDNAQAARARYIMLGVKPQMMRGVMAAGTGARRIQPSTSRCHFPASSMGCTSVSSYSPFSVSVTSADSGARVPLPLVEKSVQSAG